MRRDFSPFVIWIILWLCAITAHGQCSNELNTTDGSDQVFKPIIHKIPDTTDIAEDPCYNIISTSRGIVASDRVLNDDWYIIPIKSTDQPLSYILELDNSQTDVIDIYNFKNDRWLKSLSAGDLVPYDERSHQHRNIILQFSTKPNDFTLFINVKNRGTYGIPINIYTESYFDVADGRRTLLIGMYLGLVIIFILLVSASLILAEYDHTHFYYLLYLIFTGLYFFIELGLGDIYFWPSAPQLEEPFIFAFILGSILSFLMLVYHLFKVKDSTTVNLIFFRILFGLIVISMLILILGLIHRDTFFILLYYLVLVSVGATFLFAWIIGYHAVLRQVAYAKYFVLAFSAMILGTIIKPLSLLGIIPYGNYVHYGGIIGHSFEIICLSTLLLLEFFRRMRYSHTLETQVVRLEKSALQAQMNPHFIFNCLNSIQNYIAINQKRKAMDYLAKFARLVRNTLDASASTVITLQQEIDMLENYLHLEQMRFKEKFDFTIECEESLDLDEIEVPPLLIQPFVENAIIHGFKGISAKGRLKIHFKIEDDDLIVIIEDNGVGYYSSQSSKNHKSMAMSITKQRLQHFNADYRENSSLSIDTGEKGNGTKVTLRLCLSDL